MRRLPLRSAASAAAGLTLVEVLMSMLVMGIGVLSVVALLPLAFIRSVQATNLTNGTILRYNAESQMYVDPLDLEYVFPKWQLNTAYAVGANPSVVLAATGNGNVRFQCTTAGTSSATEPIWNTTIGATTTDGTTVTWTAVDHSHYVIDPLGWNTMTAASNGLQGALGNNGNSPPANGTPAVPPTGTAIERFNGGISAGIAAAAQLVTLPDSWTQQWRGPVASSTVNSITVNGPDLSGVGYSASWQASTSYSPGATVLPLPSNGFVYRCSAAGTSGATQPSWPTTAGNTVSDGTVTWTASAGVPAVSRVVLIDSTGRVSQTRLVTNISSPASNPMVLWGGSAGTDPLTGGFQPAQVRVETQEQRYTWMLTIQRTTAAPPNVTAAIFFRRSLTPADEQTYTVNGNTDGVTAPFTINYSGQKPFAKKGGFMFDVTYGRWYRVTSVTDTGTQLTIFVDHPRPQSDSVAAALPPFTVVFMRGVVDVYSFPMGS